jgi:hypothetical protein
MTNTYSAIPTLYQGIKYRSRLEARWAALFDALDWEHTYEPVDCHFYVPDFCVHLASPLIVECKPALDTSGLVDACAKVDRGGWAGDALVVGATIWPESVPERGVSRFPAPPVTLVINGMFVHGSVNGTIERASSAIRIGRMRTNARTWVDAYLDCTSLDDGVHVWSVAPEPRALTSPEFMLARMAWADASNATQWMPTRARFPKPESDRCDEHDSGFIDGECIVCAGTARAPINSRYYTERGPSIVAEIIRDVCPKPKQRRATPVTPGYRGRS